MPEEMRGAIDRFEEEFAVIVFDDDQQLDVPRAQLPEGAGLGDVVVVRLGDGPLRGKWSRGRRITLADGQSIKWPGKRGKGKVDLKLEVDTQDTAARRARVKSVLNDIFKDKPRPE